MPSLIYSLKSAQSFFIMLEDELATQSRLLDSIPTRLVKLKKLWNGGYARHLFT